MAYYDVEKIIEDANIFDYVKEKGIPYYSNGRSVSIHCPSHLEILGKEDRNFGNCVLSYSGRGYYCYACQKGGSIIGLAQRVFDYNFLEACASIVEFLGEPSLYLQDPNGFESFAYANPMPFTSEELETIGIIQNITTSCPVNETSSKLNLPHNIATKASYCVVDGDEVPTYTLINEKRERALYDLFTEDRQAYYDMIFIKTIEKMEDLRDICSRDTISTIIKKSKIQQGFENYALEQFNICKGILEKFQFPCNVELPLHHQQRISRFSQ